MRKSREKELRARKEKSPLREKSRRGNAYERKVKDNVAKTP
jgi:hypothetical protein